MNTRFARLVTGLVVAAVAATGMVSAGAPASAYTGNPPWVAGDTALKGAIKIYDTNGGAITGGTDFNVLGQYYAGQTAAARTGATLARLWIALPDHANATPSTWFADLALQPATAFSTAPGAPVAVGPVIAKRLWPTGTTPIADLLSGGTLDVSSVAYQNVFELRMGDSGSGVSADGKYWAVDIEYNPAALGGATYDGLAPQAWRVVYPVSSTIQAAVSTPVPSLASPQVAGTQITVTSIASVAGTIQFSEDGTNVGTPVTVGVDFSATSAPVTLAAGDHTFAAAFTPANASSYTGATSGDLAFTVLGTPTTVTKPTSSLLSPRAFGNTIRLTATATAGVAGTIRFKDSGNLITGVPAVVVSGAGAATSAAFQPAVGAHSFTAVFTPTDYLNYQQSPVSAALAFSVTKGVFVNKVQPKITGTAAVGKTLTAYVGTWTPVPTSYTYVWKRGTTQVGKAKTYKLTSRDKGKKVTVTVTAIKANYTNKSRGTVAVTVK